MGFHSMPRFSLHTLRNTTPILTPLPSLCASPAPPPLANHHHCLRARWECGDAEAFELGVSELLLPVESNSIVVLSQEDLEKSLQRARQRMTFSFPAKEGDIQVAALEEIIEGMKDASCSKWDDVVFVPPSYDIPTDISQLKKWGQRR